MTFRLAAAAVCVVGMALGACDGEEREDDRGAGSVGTASSEPAAPGEAAPRSEITCDYPVKADDTATSLLARYGADARAETLGGPEGTEFDGIALWPDDPKRRIEVIPGEGEGNFMSALRVWDASEWRVAGLALGSSLADVRQANGKPFELWGFGWDYGGYVSDLKEGRLAALPGGCSLSLRLEPARYEVLGDEMSGEVTLSSDDAALQDAGVHVVELTVGFPE